MTRIYSRMYWPPVDFTGVAQIQPVTSGVPLLLNGTYYDPFTNRVDFISKGFSRNIQFPEGLVADLVITIKGLQNGVAIEEEIITDGGSTRSVLVYDYVTSIIITSDDPLGTIGVGTGTRGYLPLIQVDTASRLAGISYGFHILNQSGELSCRILATYDNVYSCGRTLQEIEGDDPSFPHPSEFFIWANGVNDSDILADTQIYNYFLIGIDSAFETTPTLTAFFMQL